MIMNKEALAGTTLHLTLQYEDSAVAPAWDKRAERLAPQNRLSRIRQLWYSYFTASPRRRNK